MSFRRLNASPISLRSYDEDDGASAGFSYDVPTLRSSVAPSSSASVSRRGHPLTHADDMTLCTASDSEDAENFKVFIRVRPPVPRELNGYRNFVDVVQLSDDVPGAITLCDAVETEDHDGTASSVVYSRQPFAFDYVHTPGSTQDEVYSRSARPAVLSVLEGYNATIMAYGQTGAGKTYTMEGFTSEEQRGIIPRSVEEVFAYVRASRSDSQTKFLVRASYMQIYNEVISDLLVDPVAPDHRGAHPKALMVRHTPQRGVYVDGLSEWIVRSPRDVYGLVERGTANRATSSTRMSEVSSRSHAIFTIVVEVLEGDEEAPTAYRFGKLNIVDLAGSEKVRQSGVSGQRLEETKNINRSLHELGNVISALASKSAAGSSAGRARHIPFRNSVLTSALRDSLGGNCKTTLIACISPALESYTESLSTLMFANRAKNIRTTAVVNEGLDQAMLLRKYERELQRLRELLHEQQQQQQQQNSSFGVAGADVSVVSELAEGRQQAEEDKEAALEALQQSSETCVKLENRIKELETMLDQGGFAGNPRTSEEYAQRLQELDRERLVMEEDKAQVDRYKQLLLKQRDIMLNLTTRLNERDETILQLQEEIDAYDAHVQLLENRLAEADAAGPSYTPAGPAAMSATEARLYLQRCRLSSCPEPQKGSSAAAAYRSDFRPGAVLTAEEKLLEVLQLHGAPATEPLDGSSARGEVDSALLLSQLHLSAEEIAQLRARVMSRADAVAQLKDDARASALQEEVTVLAMQLAGSEAQLALYRRYLDAHSSASSTAAMRSILAEESAAVKKLVAARAAPLQEELGHTREDHQRLTRELDRVQLALNMHQEAAQVTPSQQAAVSRMWQALQVIGDELADLHHSTARENATAAGAKRRSEAALADAVRHKEQAWQRILADQQREVDQLSAQLQSGATASGHVDPSPTTKDAAAKDAEIASLARELDIQRKDRRALKTILDQRMRTKVDRICDILARQQSAGDATVVLELSAKLSSEAKSLQTLIGASIKAMES